jgi:hypothetical protein
LQGNAKDMSEIAYPNAPDIHPDDYLVLGVATCFTKEEGEVSEVQALEPIPSGYLEALVKGVETSYQYIWATTLQEVLVGETLQMPDRVGDGVQFGYDFAERAIAAVRTYKARPEAMSHLTPGQQWNELNYSIHRKRVLNMEQEVTATDNVKQHDRTHKVL